MSIFDDVLLTASQRLSDPLWGLRLKKTEPALRAHHGRKASWSAKQTLARSAVPGLVSQDSAAKQRVGQSIAMLEGNSW